MFSPHTGVDDTHQITFFLFTAFFVLFICLRTESELVTDTQASRHGAYAELLLTVGHILIREQPGKTTWRVSISQTATPTCGQPYALTVTWQIFFHITRNLCARSRTFQIQNNATVSLAQFRKQQHNIRCIHKIVPWATRLCSLHLHRVLAPWVRRRCTTNMFVLAYLCVVYPFPEKWSLGRYGQTSPPSEITSNCHIRCTYAGVMICNTRKS